jgi:hypothetical protein
MVLVTDWRDATVVAMAAAQVAKDRAAAAAQAAALAEQGLVGSKIAWTADVAITYSGLIVLNLAPRTKTFDVPAALGGDRVYVHRTGYPTIAGVNVLVGIMVEGTGFVGETAKVDVYHIITGLGAGQTMNIPLRLVGYRPSST